MLKKTAQQKKLIVAFGVAWLAAIIITALPARWRELSDRGSCLYAGIILAWGFLVKRRIANSYVRRTLLLASYLMAALFVLRLCRWDFFSNSPLFDEYVRYAYYVCFTAVPLCAFQAAVCVGRPMDERPPRATAVLWLIQAAFVAVFFTNPLHGLLFRNIDILTESFEHGPLYYAYVIWGSVLGVASFLLILVRCRVSASRKKWYIPVIGMAFGAGLLLFYYAWGGSPAIGPFKLYFVQEAFCMTFIAPFEGMFQTGILPGNSHYGLFFNNGSIHAAILDAEGNIAFSSGDYSDAPPGENERICEQEIHGGKIIWRENLTEIRAMEKRILQATEQLADENELIRQENKIRAERIGYETKNRLYDKIAGAVKEQAMAIRDELQGDPEEEKLLEKLPRVAIRGAYVKRMGNLMLLADEKGTVSVRELGSAIRESLDSVRLLNCGAIFTAKGEEEIPAPYAMLTYAAFETALESGMQDMGNVSVRIHADKEKGFKALIETDGTKRPLPEAWRAKEMEKAGAELTVTSSDGTWSVRLTGRLSGERGETA